MIRTTAIALIAAVLADSTATASAACEGIDPTKQPGLYTMCKTQAEDRERKARADRAAAQAAADAEGRFALPHYEVELRCKHMADIDGTRLNAVRADCLRAEQEAYDSLKPYWDTVAGIVQRKCNRMARLAGYGSFVILKGCVDGEMEARESPPPKFRY